MCKSFAFSYRILNEGTRLSEPLKSSFEGLLKDRMYSFGVMGHDVKIVFHFDGVVICFYVYSRTNSLSPGIQ